jgi:hypothetical protein
MEPAKTGVIGFYGLMVFGIKPNKTAISSNMNDTGEAIGKITDPEIELSTVSNGNQGLRQSVRSGTVAVRPS